MLLFILFQRFYMYLLNSSVIKVITISMLVPVMVRRQRAFLVLPRTLAPYLHFKRLHGRVTLTALNVKIGNGSGNVRQASQGTLKVRLQVRFTTYVRPVSLNVRHAHRYLDRRQRLLLHHPLLGF